MKTIPNKNNFKGVLRAIAGQERKADANEMALLLEELTGLKPQMCGTSILGFGSYYYMYNSGREGDMRLTGFSPRKQN